MVAGAAGAVAGMGALARVAGGDTAPHPNFTSVFVRDEEPRIRISIPEGWVASKSWSESDNPLPLVAVKNRDFDAVGLDASLLIRETDLPPDGVVITVAGVPIDPDETYMAPIAPIDTFSAAAVSHVPSGVSDVTMLFSWVVREDARWGYLLYGWIGPEAGESSEIATGVLDSVRFD